MNYYVFDIEFVQSFESLKLVKVKENNKKFAGPFWGLQKVEKWSELNHA